MFEKGTIWAFPTDTSFGLGVRCDDAEGLDRLFEVKKREAGKFFSLMVRNEAMLREYAEVPDDRDWEAWFMEKPRTAIFKPSDQLPQSPFWPTEKVAFRIAPLDHLKPHIEVPVTATSANLSGQDSIFSVNDICLVFGDKVSIDKTLETLPPVDPSEIWDFTGQMPVKIR